MRERLHQLVLEFICDESGQSITEYGAIIGFVGVLIAMAFNLARNGLFAGVSQSFSVTNSNLNAMNQTALSSS